MKTVYLDNNATTMVAPEVREAMLPFLGELYGNPSSIHSFGGRVRKDVEKARARVARLIGASSEEIIFTSGGSESDNQAILGTVEALGPGKRHIITTRVEHPAVRATCYYLREKGYRLTELGVEGLMVSPGYAYKEVSDRELFLERQESTAVFRKVLDPSKGFPFYNNPLYLDFLRGERDYPCAAWTTPTYTVLGWRKPCYILADEHTDDINELFDPALWERYGPGKDRRCTNCMMHSGFEGASILEALSRPRDLLTLARGEREG